MKTTIQNRIASMRQIMAKNNIDAAIFPQTDPHQSEYLADHWQVRRFLSGFNGSAGTLVLTASDALLWTDSRYFLQAADQLDGTGITLMKEGLPGTPTIEEYLLLNLSPSSRVGIDGMLFSVDNATKLQNQLAAKNISVDVNFAPINQLWTDRPDLPDAPAIIHDIKYAGLSASEKISKILETASHAGADSILISPLDEIAWTLNLRSRDVNYNPVLTSFLFLSPSLGNTLFVNPAKITADVAAHLNDANVNVAPYSAIADFLASLPDTAKVHISSAQTASTLASILGNRAVTGTSAVATLKGCKNDTQIDGIRNAMIRDGVALVGAFMEIENKAATRNLTELDVAAILRKHRSQQPLFFDESFGTIAGWGPHGAIVHYEADDNSNATISGNNLLLIDSGAQYLDGTTDITRTIAIGDTTPRQRRDFTLVMKGHIALATAIFPQGTHGLQLDALARQFLWKDSLTYLHGTGHGVGHFLNVHEGPQRISLMYVPAPLTPGMITSNEPGIYRAGQWGIRCENLTLVVPVSSNDMGNFYGFETLTLFPFDRNLLDISILTPEEIQWLDNYHQKVFTLLSPALPDEHSRQWLAEKTAPLSTI